MLFYSLSMSFLFLCPYLCDLWFSNVCGFVWLFFQVLKGLLLAATFPFCGGNKAITKQP